VDALSASTIVSRWPLISPSGKAAYGALLGALVSLCSVGAGALGRMPSVRVVGSDLAHAVPLTLVAGLGHWVIGSVDWSIVGALLLGSLPDLQIGQSKNEGLMPRAASPSESLT
jgi:uncharacterized membrane protein YfcA